MLSGSGTNKQPRRGQLHRHGPDRDQRAGQRRGCADSGRCVSTIRSGARSRGRRNVISGNGGDGVEIDGGGVLFAGNTIGVDSGGFAGNLLPNGGDGVQIKGGSGNTIDGGVIAAGSGTLTLDAGGGANHLLHASLIGGPGPADRRRHEPDAHRRPAGAAGGRHRLPGHGLRRPSERHGNGEPARGVMHGSDGEVAIHEQGDDPARLERLRDRHRDRTQWVSGTCRCSCRTDSTTGVNNLADPCGGTSPPRASVAAPCAPLPKSPSPKFVPSAAGPDGRWLDAVFHDLLGQSPTPADLNSLTKLLKGVCPESRLSPFSRGTPTARCRPRASSGRSTRPT